METTLKVVRRYDLNNDKSVIAWANELASKNKDNTREAVTAAEFIAKAKAWRTSDLKACIALVVKVDDDSFMAKTSAISAAFGVSPFGHDFENGMKVILLTKAELLGLASSLGLTCTTTAQAVVAIEEITVLEADFQFHGKDTSYGDGTYTKDWWSRELVAERYPRALRKELQEEIDEMSSIEPVITAVINHNIHEPSKEELLDVFVSGKKLKPGIPKASTMAALMAADPTQWPEMAPSYFKA